MNGFRPIACCNLFYKAISKAFDTVQWSFIINTLKAMHYPKLFIHLIHLCNSTATFLVSTNGELTCLIHSSRGIRQG